MTVFIGSDDIGGFEESEEGGTQELSDHEDDNDLGGMVKVCLYISNRYIYIYKYPVNYLLE